MFEVEEVTVRLPDIEQPIVMFGGMLIARRKAGYGLVAFLPDDVALIEEGQGFLFEARRKDEGNVSFLNKVTGEIPCTLLIIGEGEVEILGSFWDVVSAIGQALNEPPL